MHAKHKQVFAERGLLTVQQCADKWGLAKQTILDRILTGKVPYVRVGGRFYGIRPETDPRSEVERKLTKRQIIERRAQYVAKLKQGQEKKRRDREEWDLETTKALTSLSMRQSMQRKLQKNSATQSSMQLETFSTSQKS